LDGLGFNVEKEWTMAQSRGHQQSAPPPQRLLIYLVFRVFNVLDRVVDGANQTWGATLRSALLCTVVLVPVLGTVIGIFLVVTDKVSAGAEWIANRVGSTSEVVNLGVGVVLFGVLVAAVHLLNTLRTKIGGQDQTHGETGQDGRRDLTIVESNTKPEPPAQTKPTQTNPAPTQRNSFENTTTDNASTDTDGDSARNL
jgi:hypothetical protein